MACWDPFTAVRAIHTQSEARVDILVVSITPAEFDRMITTGMIWRHFAGQAANDPKEHIEVRVAIAIYREIAPAQSKYTTQNFRP